MLSYFRWPISWQSQALTPTAKTKHIHLQVPLLYEVQYYFLSFQPTRSLASPLKCLFSNCLLNWGSWFPDGALPSTCTQSLLVRSGSPSCWSDHPPPRPTEGCTEEILRRRVPPPRVCSNFGGDVICGLNLRPPRERESLLKGTVYRVGDSCSWLPHFSMWQTEQSHSARSAGLKAHHRPELPPADLKLHRWLVKLNWLVL